MHTHSVHRHSYLLFKILYIYFQKNKQYKPKVVTSQYKNKNYKLSVYLYMYMNTTSEGIGTCNSLYLCVDLDSHCWDGKDLEYKPADPVEAVEFILEW